MASHGLQAPIKGRRSIVETLSYRAATQPDRIFGSFAQTDDIDNGFHDVTFGNLARAVDACAWYVKETFGLSETFEPLLYLGIYDYRYTIITFAAIKCGYKALFVNPRYPTANILTLMRQTDCNKALYSKELFQTIDDVHRNMPRLSAAELAPPLHWLAASPKPFHFTKTFADSKDHPILVLHSSGTTGAPKPITYTNAWIAVQDLLWPDSYGRPGGNLTLREEFNGGFTYSQFPQPHYGGVLYTTLRPLLTESAASVLGPPGAELDDAAGLALTIIKKKQIKALAAVPLLLENIVRLPGGTKALATLNCVTFSGGPLRSELGDDLVRKGIKLMSSYGSTEFGSCPIVLPDPEDWEWTHFHPDFHAQLEPTGDGAGTHELTFPDSGPEVNAKRGSFHSLGVNEYGTKDLFVRRPTKDWLWKYYGRTDDILVLAHADKLNPIPIENAIASVEGVSGVLVAGANRWPACVLVEVREGYQDDVDLLKRARKKLTVANEALREDTRIPMDMIMVLKPGALVRGMKGQVMRKASAEGNAEIIDRLYAKREESWR